MEEAKNIVVDFFLHSDWKTFGKLTGHKQKELVLQTSKYIYLERHSYKNWSKTVLIILFTTRLQNENLAYFIYDQQMHLLLTLYALFSEWSFKLRYFLGCIKTLLQLVGKSDHSADRPHPPPPTPPPLLPTNSLLTCCKVSFISLQCCFRQVRPQT